MTGDYVIGEAANSFKSHPSSKPLYRQGEFRTQEGSPTDSPSCGLDTPDSSVHCAVCGALLHAPRVIIKEARLFESGYRPTWTRRERALYLGLRVPVALALILGGAYMMASDGPFLEQHTVMPIVFFAGVALLVISLIKASVD